MIFNESATELEAQIRSLPVYGWFGFGLVIICWILNWSLSGLHTHWIFFPLWLGYCLTIDALVFARKSTSLITRNPIAYIGLFIISVPVWWLFEFINWRTQNWFYEGRQYFSDLQYFMLASLSFSTVIPAVFGTAELVSTFYWIKKVKRGPRITTKPKSLISLFLIGYIMMVLLLLLPLYFFPFIWISIYLMLEPLNVYLKNRSLIQYTAKCDWRPVLALCVGGLICGFFWEMWNFYSYPKWVYRVPFVGFFNIFEMPLLGYLGYLPFSLELFAVYHLVIGFLKPGKIQDFVQLSPDNF